MATAALFSLLKLIITVCFYHIQSYGWQVQLFQDQLMSSGETSWILLHSSIHWSPACALRTQRVELDQVVLFCNAQQHQSTFTALPNVFCASSCGEGLFVIDWCADVISFRLVN